MLDYVRQHLANAFILWCLRRPYPIRIGHGAQPQVRSRWVKTPIVSDTKQFLFWRYEPFWRDESTKTDPKTGRHYARPPWWRPFGILLHQWCSTPNYLEDFHDHPRWSVTICLRGKLIEHTPWGRRMLRPGSLVVRTRKFIHAFEIPAGYARRTWTLFIVGRRNHAQNVYRIKHFDP